MKACIRKNLELRTDVVVPTCSNLDIRVKVKAAALNPVDYKVGWPIFGPICSSDFAGIVDEVGPGVTDYKVGDEVYGVAGGSLAEYALTSTNRISSKPTTLTFGEAAALPVAYLTSVQAFTKYGGLKSGGRVLIIGASGGCGVAGIQVAKALGAKDIVGVCSGRNVDFVKSVGATEVVDYTKHNVLEHFKGEDGNVKESDKFDVIYDAATGSGGGEDYLALSRPLLREASAENQHGQYVAINGNGFRWLRSYTIGLPRNEHLFFMNPSPDDFKTLSALIDEQKTVTESPIANFKPIIARTFSLTQDDVTEAFELLKSRRTVGKIVFDMEESNDTLE